jgi:fumarate reductase flavoprotein subunit
VITLSEMKQEIPLNRRDFLKGMAGVAGVCGIALSAGCTPKPSTPDKPTDQVSTEGEASSEVMGEPVEVLETDVVVVGTGTAGLSAANQALDAGLDIIVIEKTPGIGGSSQFAEVMFANGSRMQQKEGLHYTDFDLLTLECDFHNWRVDRTLWSKVVAVSGESINWFLDKVEPYGGGFMELFGDMGGVRVAHAFGFVEQPSGEPIGKGRGQLMILNKIIEDAGVQVITNCEGRKLIVEGDKVVGIYAEGPDGLIRVNAKAVILATGGFTGNPEMFTEMGRDHSQMMVRGFSTNTGDGIRMAREIGADHRGSLNAQLMGPSLPIPDSDKDRYINTAACLMGFPIWVNQEGVRFVPEAIQTLTITANSIDMQDVTWSIFDNAQAARYDQFVLPNGFGTYFAPGTVLDQTTAEINKFLDQKVDWAHKANTLEELSGLIGVPYAGLQKTVDRYNELVAAGEDADFGKPAELLASIETPPFYGFKVHTNLLCTMGGIRINSNAQVLKPGGIPIDGLYAAGCDCDGFTGETYGVHLPGSTQGIALCTGRLAALHTAEYINQ